MIVLELREVHRVHGSGATTVHALRGVTLSVRAGELVAVMGPSGSGKSTLLNLAGGLDRPSRGEVAVDGTVLGTCDRRALAALRRRLVGYVFQDLNLLASLTAAENVALPLELVGLAAHAEQLPGELSGGQQQRVAIARALAGSPRLLVADEPTGQLDAETGLSVMALLRGVVESEGVTALVSTHDPVMIALADRAIRISDGRIDGQDAGSAPC